MKFLVPGDADEVVLQADAETVRVTRVSCAVKAGRFLKGSGLFRISQRNWPAEIIGHGLKRGVVDEDWQLGGEFGAEFAV